MTFSTLILMFSFSLTMSITPGPVNLMILSSGINHGFKKTFSFVSGATIGFTLLLSFLAFGFSSVLSSNTMFMSILEIIGSSFIIYMGYKISQSSSSLEIKNNKELKFYEGFLLQWLNPKAWIASISGIIMFQNSNFELLIFILMYFFICYFSLSFWSALGQKTTKYLNTEKRLKIFNYFMGYFLIISALLYMFSKYI